MQSKYQGSFVGLAMGDTLGMAIEFKNKSEFEPLTGPVAGGPFKLPLGYWTDDTSMALCLADSLIELGGYDSFNVMDKYWEWRANGYRSSTGHCFDIGNQTSTAISYYKQHPIVSKNMERDWSAGNGSIMRLAPAVIASHGAGDSLEQTMTLCSKTARETHYSFEAEAGTALFGAMLYNAFDVKDKNNIFKFGDYGQNEHFIKISNLVSNAGDLTIDKLKPTGYIVNTLQCAIWAFMNYSNFKDGALAAVNLGGDADTIGAVYGQLAGAYYGYENIPADWLNVLHKRKEIVNLAEKLGKMPTCKILRTRFEEDDDKYIGEHKITITQGDIAQLKVDAIVNAANTSLFGGSGVAGAIFNAAGYEEMTKACKQIGACEFGDAVMTSGFKLPAKYVIHTAGPIYGQHGGEEADILKSCYWQSLNLAQEKGLQTVAFPLISTGIYGYPKQQAAELAIQAIKEYFEDNPQTSITEVKLCAFTTEDKTLLTKLKP